MQHDAYDGVVSLIYDAALDDGLWGKVMLALAGLLDTGQASFEWHDHDTGAMIRQAPLTDPAFSRSWREHYGREFTLLKRTGAFPVGRVFRTADFVDVEWMAKTAYFNEWWKPQGVGGGSLFANLAIGPHALVLTTVCKHLGGAFSPEEERAFAAAAHHMKRAVEIHARMQLAALGRPAAAAETPGGMIVVDGDARILSGDQAALAELRAAGLIDRLDGARILTPDRAVERLARTAAKAGDGGARAGSCTYCGRDGTPFEIMVFPCSEQGRAATWLKVDKPAALLQVTRPGARRQARIARLVRDHGLTPGEAAVALEIASGEGRAAAAARLGIRETTVRSHLSAIFDKLGIGRQAELARLVAGD